MRKEKAKRIKNLIKIYLKNKENLKQKYCFNNGKEKKKLQQFLRKDVAYIKLIKTSNILLNNGVDMFNIANKI